MPTSNPCSGIKMRTLGDVATYINGRAFKPNDWETCGLPIIRIQNLTNPSAPYNYSSKELEEKYKVRQGDLLFAWSASLGAHIWRGHDAWLNQHIFRVIPSEGISKKYLYYFLLQTTAKLYTKTHGSGMVHITKGPFMNTPIPVPPLSEQERIVSKIEELFSRLDASVAELQTAKEKLKAYRQIVLREAFSCIKNKVFLRSLFDGTPQNGIYKPKSAYGKGTRILRIDGFYDGFINSEYQYKRLSLSQEEIQKYGLNLFDLVINRVNSMPYLGKCALVRHISEPTVFESNIMRVRLNSEIVFPEYITYFLTSDEGRKELIKNAKQAVNQASINQTDVGNVLVPLPADIALQRQIVSRVERQLSVCNSIEQTTGTSLQQAEALRQSILKQAFEGEL